MKTKILISITLLAMLCGPVAMGRTRDYLKKPDSWFDNDEAEQIAENILSWQSKLGGWPKNVDPSAMPYEGNSADLKPTFDNGATTDELRFLARVFNENHDNRYKEAFKRGFDYIIDAQYSSGGWPQFYPPGKHYHRYITFNDDAMVRLMYFLRDTWEDDRYDFLDRNRMNEAREAFEDGIECILKCQIKVDGTLTAWCAQHDENNYKPRPARAFELTSISGSESVGIVRLLMDIDDPEPDVVEAVEAAVAWFREVGLDGIRVEVEDGDKVVVEKSSAPLLWARFYEIDTNRPIFCGRDGVKKYDLAEIDHERRNHYRWYGNWAQRLLEKEYPEWKKRID